MIDEERVDDEIHWVRGDGVCSYIINSLPSGISNGLLVLGQILRSTWREWTSGWAPLFWRWNGEERIESARDGMRIFVKSALPRSRKGSKPPRFDMETQKLVSAKVEAMVIKCKIIFGAGFWLHVPLLLCCPRGRRRHLRRVWWNVVRFEWVALEPKFLSSHIQKCCRDVIVFIMYDRRQLRRVFP